MNRAYLASGPFQFRLDYRALSRVKSYSVDQCYKWRWIVGLDGINNIFEHMNRDKHQNADNLSKIAEFYDTQEPREAAKPR